MTAFILCGLTLGALGLIFIIPGAKLYDDSVDYPVSRMNFKPVEGWVLGAENAQKPASPSNEKTGAKL